MTFSDKLEELFIDLPEPAPDRGNAVAAMKVGKLLHVGGVLPFAEGRLQFPGRAGVEVRLDNARMAARTAAVQMLAIVARELGSIDKVRRVVRLDGLVASGADFSDHEKVVDGASELFVQLFGPFGKHVRTAAGAASLPRGACVQLSAVFEVK